MKKVGKLTESRMVKPPEPKTFPVVSDGQFASKVMLKEATTPKAIRKARARAQAGKPIKKGTAKMVASDPGQELDVAMKAGEKLSTEGSGGIKRLGRVRVGLRKKHAKAVNTMIYSKDPKKRSEGGKEEKALVKKTYSTSYKIGAKGQDGRNRTNRKKAAKAGAEAAAKNPV